ncbi:MAG: hypothetical protein WA061_03670 [Microgenomates group bacterium]
MKKTIIVPLILGVILLVFAFKSGSNKSLQQSTSQTDISETSTNTPKTAQENSTYSKSLDLVIDEPLSGTEVQKNSITIKGRVNPKAHVIVNEADVTLGVNGKFDQQVTLDEGENYISIVAYDDEGNAAERELLIIRTIEGL